ncbi:MAG: hypothetical protein ABI972_10310 [Acidobacteriota bacterium]
MNHIITVDHHHLYYEDGEHKLTLSVEWSGVSKTEDFPCEFEIHAGELTHWTEPKGAPIDDARREALLDELAAHYSKPPMADIIGTKGELLRGQSKYRFSLQIYPEPSRYYEVGRFLAIPMAQPVQGSREFAKRYILDLRGITEWTRPKVPLDRAHLERMIRKIVDREKIGVIGLTGA